MVGVLQESVDEHLTQLGEKLACLPLHPSTSRMLIFSILMNCLDPALTLACASECKDSFLVPILPDEKKRAAAARSELASLYGGCGDQFAIVAAFECWHNSKKMGLESRFCSQYFVSQSAMNKLSGMRKNLAAKLYQNGLIHGHFTSYCSNAHDPGILQAVLVAGMYPMVGKLVFPFESGKNIFFETKSGNNVCLNSHSVNSKLLSQKSFDCSFVVYDENEITSSNCGMCIRNCTVVGLLPLFLLSKEIAVVLAKDCTDGHESMSSDNVVRVIIDQWLYFESTEVVASRMNYLRERLSAAILYKVTHSTDVLPPVLQAAVDALACILSCHGLSGIPLTSDLANTLTTIKATNPKEFQTEVINQDAQRTNNPSEIKASEPDAIENPSNQTSQNAPIGLACSTPTKHIGKTPVGFCTGLINHNDVPSSGTSISTSNGAENPSDPPTSWNTATGSAYSIQSAHINDDATMIDVTPSKDPNPTICPEDPNSTMWWNASKGGRYQKISVEWTFPEVGWMKANVDGSYKDLLHLTSSAGVFRDSTGSWCFGFALNLGNLSCGSSTSAKACISHFIVVSELWSILTALKLAREKGILQLWIETDSSPAVDCVLNKRVQKDDPFAPLVESILELMTGNLTVRVSHCYREANKVADWLSKYAHTTEVGLHVLDVPPPGCVKYLTDDSTGVHKLRTVRVND